MRLWACSFNLDLTLFFVCSVTRIEHLFVVR